MQPQSHELHALQEVLKPRVQRLQARVGDRLAPDRRHPLYRERVVHLLQLGGHHHQTFYGLAQRHQSALDSRDQEVESIHFLAVEDAERDDASIWGFLVRLRVCILLLHKLGHPLQEACGHICHEVLGLFASASRRHARLHADHGVEELPGGLGLSRDLSIGVQAVHLGILIHRQASNVFTDLFQGPLLRGIVGIQWTQLVFVVKELFVEVPMKESADQTHILVVRDSAAIVDLCDDVVQRDPRHARLRFQVHLDLLPRDLEIAIHPLVGHVPTDGSELPAFQDRRVEEGQGEQQLLVLSRLRAALIHLGLDVLEGPVQVCTQALRGLVGDLDTTLQDRHWEGWGRH
mmetsp:Transcript_49842/g.161284  ORF Transcript_49842/g.161284 Transcript_49842/m.161284 type:complete len:347 (-) Transcript_49842:949-1989(-)